MTFKVGIDIGRLRLVFSNDALLSGIKCYSKRIGKISLVPWQFLWCLYSK